MTKLERIIITSRPVDFIITRSKQLILPGFQGLPLYDVVLFLLRQIKKEGLNIRAAAISFNLLMAIPPFLIFLFTLVPYLPGQQDFVRELLRLIRDLTPNRDTYIWVRDFIVDFTKPRSGLLSIGFITAGFFASNAMLGIMNSFNRSLHVMYRQKRNFFQSRGTALKLTFFIATIFMASILLLISQGSILRSVLRWMNIESDTIRWWISSLRWIVIIALIYYAIGLIYRFAPAIQRKWNVNSPGTILATSLIILLTILFSYWVNNFGTYNKVYGSIGTVIILMSSFFFNSLILLIGFELNVSINHLKMEAETRQEKEEGQG
ncbi:YihY/virulence factor BrkB family protein [Agriterribacter sp.]|uniref:YihY/virulence factor BrkB family protein n=1 Tax=Agriterribacter sp. TaxID=2821509 RepID=UPI002C006049|nr:YihY/virulence factor BrkB family protein [Agriterribacter sp.]HRO45830.1 YihY/virulence factor BrkB family protein [Agriterribacter sp.]HRQ16715.1 YihY/virulence factor BrkB family protein [Agriterribacter sp.]